MQWLSSLLALVNQRWGTELSEACCGLPRSLTASAESAFLLSSRLPPAQTAEAARPSEVPGPKPSHHHLCLILWVKTGHRAPETQERECQGPGSSGATNRAGAGLLLRLLFQSSSVKSLFYQEVLPNI